MNSKSMSEKQKKEDYNTVNQKIQERLSRRNNCSYSDSIKKAVIIRPQVQKVQCKNLRANPINP